MHIPNGFLTDPVCTVSTLASAGALGVSFARAARLDNSGSGALMAATGAGIFAAQMVNFPIEHGTSGHLLGAAMAAIILGPWRGMLTMAVVLAAQCLLFGDGGLGTLGANILNMAVAGTLVAAVLYNATTRYNIAGTRGKLVGTAVAACGSVLASASLCAVELAASGTYGLADVWRAMITVHAVIGLGEVIVSVALVAAVLAIQAQGLLSARRATFAGAALAIAVAGLIAPLASSAPDGLERVAEDLQFANQASANLWALAPDYAVSGIAWPALAGAMAGIVGVVVVFCSTYMLNRAATAKVRKQ